MASGAGFGALMGMGIGMLLLFFVVGVVVGTLILMMATKLVEKWMPSFVKALVVTIVCFIAAIVVSWILHLVLGFGMFGGLIRLVVGFLVTAAIIQQLLTRPGTAVTDGGAMAVASGAKMSFGRACLITLIEYVVYIILGIIFVFTVGGAMFAAMAH
ncbi:MAG: hypothetical protein ACREPP_10220 [Rhodanobacteraceae bacterium]